MDYSDKTTFHVLRCHFNPLLFNCYWYPSFFTVFGNAHKIFLSFSIYKLKSTELKLVTNQWNNLCLGKILHLVISTVFNEVLKHPYMKEKLITYHHGSFLSPFIDISRKFHTLRKIFSDPYVSQYRLLMCFLYTSVFSCTWTCAENTGAKKWQTIE